MQNAASPLPANPALCPIRSWVVATQNPIEQEGTYPLPEAQLDRFMFFTLSGLSRQKRGSGNRQTHHAARKTVLTPSVNAEDLLRVQRLVCPRRFGPRH